MYIHAYIHTYMHTYIHTCLHSYCIEHTCIPYIIASICSYIHTVLQYNKSILKYVTPILLGVMMIPKYQFPPTPHILEPINLLTIEAFQTRMPGENKMNYYTTVCKALSITAYYLYPYDILSYKELDIIII